VRRIVVVSIIGIDRFTGGYAAAKVPHEQATLAGRSRRGSFALWRDDMSATRG
jgi:hypothetical protein